MVRGKFYHDPARKHIEQFQDFSGGLNTMSSNDNISDRELTKLENVDLGDRGSLTRRKGYRSDYNINATGFPQGLFQFHRRRAIYNLLGVEGSFDGERRSSGQNYFLGGWYVFNMPNEADAYKVERAESNQLVVNGDFEDGETGWELNVDKREVGDSLVGKSVHSQTGNNVLRIRSFQNHSGMINEYQKKEVPVTPGKTLRVETMVRRAAISVGNIPYRAHIVLSFLLNNGTRERHYFNTYTINNQWQQIQEDFTVPPNAVSVLLGVGILDNDTSQDIAAYFEGAQLFELSGNLAVNGEFEDGESGWNLDVSEENGDSFVGRSIHARTGENVLRLRGRDGFRGYINEYQDKEISVKPGDRVYARTYHRRAAVSIGDIPHQALLVCSVLKTNGTRERMYLRDNSISDSWNILYGTFEMPKDAVSVLLGVGIRKTDLTGDDAAYFDSFYSSIYEQKAENVYFEDGEDGWELDVSLTTAGDSYIGSSVHAISGNNVMRVRRFAGHGGYYNEYQYKEVKASAGEEIYAEIMYRSASTTIGYAPYRVHLIASVKKSDGSRERFYINKYDCDNTWRKLSNYFVMPSNTVSVRFGVGIIDNKSDRDVAAYFDNMFVRKEIQGSDNSVVAIRSTSEDTSLNRGLGMEFTGIDPNKYYVYLVDFTSDRTDLRGGLAVRDERFGLNQQPENLVGHKTFDGTDKWTTQFLKFKTSSFISEARAYVYNYSRLGVLGNVYYDNARIYEVTPEEYELVGVDPEWSGTSLGEKFPYRVGQLSSGKITETVTAIGGKFYVDGVEKPVVDDIPIQTERTMEAVEYGDKLYIASGSGLLEYNGATIAKISPYVPDNLETLYIGTNGMVENSYVISDVEQSVVELKSVRFNKRYGVTNKDTVLTVSVGKPANTLIEYKFERRNVRDKEGYWQTIKDWSNEGEVTFNTNIAGEYQFRISVRDGDGELEDEDENELVLDVYEIPKYIIKPTDDVDDIPIDGNTIHQCNRILVHWDRILLYGDEAKPDVLYISDLYNPNYFPVNNTLQFVNPRKERITSAVRYRDNLVVFTKSSIQALFGTNPEDYERVMLNTDIGCIADRSAKVVQNSIAFLSYEGVSMLKTVGTSESKANISSLDGKVKNLVEFSEDAVGYVINNQYHLAYPKSRTQLRYYYEWDVWSYDTSLTSLDFTDVYIEDNKLNALGRDGRIIVGSEHYDDEGDIFKAYVGTKMFDFKEPYAVKKTRELQIMLEDPGADTSVHVDVYVDNSYTGEKIVIIEDFDREITKNVEKQYYKTEIKPYNANTLKKDFNYSVYDGSRPRERISNFSYRKNATITFSGSGVITNGSQGLQVKDGEVYQIRNNGQRYYETLAVYDDGSMGIIEYSEDTDPNLDNVQHTFHFGPYMIKDGVKRTSYPNVSDHEYIVEQKQPRQAVGQRADGTYVFITVDGRSDVAEGMTIYELADVFEQENCVVAYNLDGGGSAQTFVDGERLNVYSDGDERARSDFIYFTKDEETIVDGDRSGIVASGDIDIVAGEEIYKKVIPGKGITVGTLITHEDSNPVKLVGLGYIFKLKKP